MLTKSEAREAASAARHFPAGHARAWLVPDGDAITDDLNAALHLRLRPGDWRFG